MIWYYLVSIYFIVFYLLTGAFLLITAIGVIDYIARKISRLLRSVSRKKSLT